MRAIKTRQVSPTPDPRTILSQERAQHKPSFLY